MKERLPLYVGLLLALVTLVTFLPVTDCGFVSFDDPDYVTANRHVQGGWSLAGLAWALTANVASNWHPLTLVSHMLDVELYGLTPRGHHLTSLLLHVLGTILLFSTLYQMTGALARSTVVALLFALHPAHVESVAWVAERKDVLSGVFFFLALRAWWRYVQTPSRGRYAATGLWMALGLAAKPMLVTLPCVLVLLDIWPLRRELPLWQFGREKLPLFALSLASAVATLAAQAGSLASTDALPLGHRFANAALAYLGYLRILAWPRGLAVFYPMPATFPFVQAALSATLLAGLTVLAFWLRRRAPFAMVGWFWYLGTLVPVIGLVQVGSQAAADRYTYLPSIGLFVVVAWGLPELMGSGRAARIGLAGGVSVAILALVVGTRAQIGTWRDSESLYRHALAVTENNHVAHQNLAQTLAAQGKRAEAIEHFRAALAIRPNTWEAAAGIGTTLRAAGEPAAALPWFRQALALAGENGSLHYSLAIALEDLGRQDEAIAELRAAIALSPELADAHYGLGALLQGRGDELGAIEQYQAALVADPGLVSLYSVLGALLAKHGRVGEAAAVFTEGARRQPDSAAAHYNLGLTLRALGREAEALRELARARELGVP